MAAINDTQRNASLQKVLSGIKVRNWHVLINAHPSNRVSFPKLTLPDCSHVRGLGKSRMGKVKSGRSTQTETSDDGGETQRS